MVKKITKEEIRKEVIKGVKGHQKQVDKQIDEVEEEFEKDINSKKNYEENLLYLLSNTKQKGLFYHNKFKEHTSTAIIAAFSFLIALVWKDLIVKLVEEYFKPKFLSNYPYLYELVTAFIVTAIAVLAIIFVSRWSKKEEKK